MNIRTLVVFLALACGVPCFGESVVVLHGVKVRLARDGWRAQEPGDQTHPRLWIFGDAFVIAEISGEGSPPIIVYAFHDSWSKATDALRAAEKHLSEDYTVAAGRRTIGGRPYSVLVGAGRKAGHPFCECLFVPTATEVIVFDLSAETKPSRDGFFDQIRSIDVIPDESQD